MNSEKYKIGIALSGGGARGIAHLGVLKALEEKNLAPEVICGASAGSIAGALYADGHSPDEIFKLDGLAKLLKDYLSVERIEDLKKPFFIGCTEFNSGKQRIFSEGNLSTLVMASCSIPILFKAVEYEGKYLIDGGVVSNLPIEPLVGKCEMLIGSHVNPIDEADDLTGWMNLVDRVFSLATYNTVRAHIPKLDLFIEPKGLAKFGIFSTSNDQAMFDLGYEEALKVIEESGH